MRITDQFNEWLERTPQPWLLAQVAMVAVPSGYELRHRDDLGSGPEALTRADGLPALREIVKHDALGRFRPLRGAPTLRNGWRMGPLDAAGLVEALNVIYPGAIGFWVARERGTLKPTEFVGTTRRQTGMYRITQVVTQDQVDRTVAEVCQRDCLRKRLWYPGSPGIQGGPSELPLLCPEACNYLISKTRETIVADREQAAKRAEADAKV